MSRLTIPTVDNAPQDSRATLAAVQQRFGVVPNLFRLAAISPAALQGYAAFSGALQTTLDAKTRERIALAVAQVNRCDYCLSAHSYIGLNVAKLTQEEIDLNRDGQSLDARAAAAVRFAKLVAETRGHVAARDVAAVIDAGYGEAQIVEIVALVAENSLTNYLNSVAETEIDFPVATANEMA